MKNEKVKIKINGLNLIRVINKSVHAGIILDNLEIKPKYFIAEIDLTSLEIIKNICKKEHKRVIILRQGLINRIFNGLKYSLGIVLAFIIIFTYFYTTSSCISSVDIISSNIEIKSKASDYLCKQNIVPGSVIEISTKKLEKDLLSNISEISGCSVRFNGGNLTIYIYPADDKQNDPDNIISKYNATITKINVFAGKTNLKVGDVVKKGDKLIYNENGCAGEVYGKAVSSSKVIYNERQQILKKTGNVFETKEIIFNNFLINSKKYKPFSSFLIENCDFCISQNYFFPLTIRIKKYYETIPVEKIVPFEEVQNEIKLQALNEAKKGIENENMITNVTYSCVKFDNYTVVDCFVEYETILS